MKSHHATTSFSIAVIRKFSLYILWHTSTTVKSECAQSLQLSTWSPQNICSDGPHYAIHELLQLTMSCSRPAAITNKSARMHWKMRYSCVLKDDLVWCEGDMGCVLQISGRGIKSHNVTDNGKRSFLLVSTATSYRIRWLAYASKWSTSASTGHIMKPSPKGVMLSKKMDKMIPQMVQLSYNVASRIHDAVTFDTKRLHGLLDIIKYDKYTEAVRPMGKLKKDKSPLPDRPSIV